MVSLRVVLLFFLAFFSICQVEAQGAFESPYLNRAVLKKYTGAQLSDLENNHPEKFKQLQYYYTKSFRVEVNGCPLCIVDLDSLVNFYLFNIADYEHMRDAAYEVSVDLKYNNYTLVLTSGIDLENQLYTIKSVNQQNTTHKELPALIQTGNLVYDFEVYKQKLLTIKSNNPEGYVLLITSNSLIKCSFEEFSQMDSSKRDFILNHPEGYLITD
ncbi:MAG: hypothetical protein ACK4K0_11595 [Flavobacteriales bacterium]